MSNLRLYPFQEIGVAFMREHKKVLLADEMGLGKTVQAIMATDNFPALIVASSGMKYFWRDEIEKWRPGFLVDILDGPYSTTADFHIVHWNLLARTYGGGDPKDRPWNEWVQFLSHVGYGTIIVDEAHKAKNRKAQRTEGLWQLTKTPVQVMLLTGSPLVNAPGDLWALLKCLDPKTYTSYWRFYKEYTLYAPTPWSRWSGEVLGVRNKEKLLAELEPLVIRRTKKTVLPELPEKLPSQFIHVELYPDQMRAYNEMVELMIAEIDDETRVLAPTVLAQITRLRQICVGFGAFQERDKWPDTSAAKLDVLCDFLADRDRPVVVASQYKWAVYEAARRLQERLKIRTTTLTGDTPEAERIEIVAALQEGQIDALCMTVQTGGEGWTLTAADTIVFLDRPWSPQVLNQAIDRLHRIGQENKVHVVSLTSLGTIEDRVEEALARKQDVFNQVFGRLKELL